MRWRRGGRVRGCWRAGSAAPASPARCRCRRRRRRLPHALGASAGVRGHGAARRAGGAAPATRPQASPFHRMGEAANTGDGGAYPRDGGAGDASAVRRRGRAARPAAQHTAAGRRVRAGRAPATTSPLSASRVDAKFPASTEQVCERRARVGGRGSAGAARRGRGGRRGRGRRRGRLGQEGRAAAEGDALVGPHGRAAAAALPARQPAAALRDGAAPRAAAAAAAARRVTTPARTPLSYHAYIPLSGRSDSPKCPRVPEYYRLGIYLFGTGGARE